MRRFVLLGLGLISGWGFVVATPFALASSRAGNGGDVVVTNDPENYNRKRLFSLDLIEYGLSGTRFTNQSIAGADNPYGDQALVSGYQYHRLRLWSYDGCSQSYCSYWVIDTPNRDTMRKIISAVPSLFEDPSAKDPRVTNTYNVSDRRNNTMVFLHLLYKINSVLPEYGDLILEKLQDLDWILTLGSLEEIRDENTPINLNHIFQIARNDDNEVRISTFPFYNFYEMKQPGCSKPEVVSPPNAVNRLAVITHEILYALRLERGDKDSKIARRANAYLYRDDPTGNSIRKSFDLIRQ